MNALVGVLRQNGKHGIVELDRKDNELGARINIPRKFLKGAPFNMKVVCDYRAQIPVENLGVLLLKYWVKKEILIPRF